MAEGTHHTVVISHEPFGVGYDVIVEPSPPGGTFAREYSTFTDAHGYARGLMLDHGWSFRDLTGEGGE